MPEAVLDQALLDELVARIVEAVRPEKGILFGSWAKGTARPDSDIDLFIQVATGEDTKAASARASAAETAAMRPSAGHSCLAPSEKMFKTEVDATAGGGTR